MFSFLVCSCMESHSRRRRSRSFRSASSRSLSGRKEVSTFGFFLSLLRLKGGSSELSSPFAESPFASFGESASTSSSSRAKERVARAAFLRFLLLFVSSLNEFSTTYQRAVPQSKVSSVTIVGRDILQIISSCCFPRLLLFQFLSSLLEFFQVNETNCPVLQTLLDRVVLTDKSVGRRSSFFSLVNEDLFLSFEFFAHFIALFYESIFTPALCFVTGHIVRAKELSCRTLKFVSSLSTSNGPRSWYKSSRQSCREGESKQLVRNA